MLEDFVLPLYLLSFIDLPLLINQTVLSYGMDARLVNSVFFVCFFLPSNLLSLFDLPLLSYIMDASLVNTEKNTCRIKDTAER